MSLSRCVRGRTSDATVSKMIRAAGREASMLELLEQRIVLSAEEGAKFDAVSEKVVARWIEEVTAKGIDGAALVAGARAAIAKAAAAR